MMPPLARRSLGGINFGDLQWVKAAHDSPYGKIVSHWQRQAENFNWQITVPSNSTATVYVPASRVEGVTESRRTANRDEGIKFLRMEAGAAVFEVQSGSYHFRSETDGSNKYGHQTAHR